MFQPTPELKPLFDIFFAALKAKTGIARANAIVWAAIKGFWGTAMLGLLPGLFIIFIAVAFGSGAGFVGDGILVALIGLTVAIIWRLMKAVRIDLVKNDFGLCPGIRQPYASCDGFSDWLARLIDEAAGRGADTDRPLTFGDLAVPRMTLYF
jgi:predicted lipid-binding transport protein (Tim44 family)